MKIQITADSTCDLGVNAAARGIEIVPLTVILGDRSYLDGKDIVPQDIFNYVERTGELPKTAAPSIGDYEEVFRSYADSDTTVLHFSISSKASSSHEHAAEAATGQGLLAMKAADLRDEGKSAEEIVSAVKTLATRVNTSFVPDRLDYLYKGGRCSRLTMYGANLLKIHPLIRMREGQLIPGAKYRGSMEKCIAAYIGDLVKEYPKYDRTRCFITHSHADESVIDVARKLVRENFDFEETLETVAGSVITGHCGRNTLGVLFIAEE